MPDFECAVCGCPDTDHDADEYGGGCGVCGDCPGYEPGAVIDDESRDW